MANPQPIPKEVIEEIIQEERSRYRPFGTCMMPPSFAEIYRVFEMAPTPLSVRDVLHATDLSARTVYSGVGYLLSKGYLRTNGSAKSYELNPQRMNGKNHGATDGT